MMYGQPGAGKGTQANLLAWKRDFFHFDTGRYLSSYVHDPMNKKNKKVQFERALYDSGKLMTPSWVLSIVKKRTEVAGKADLSLVYSGSPRTMFEAFGDAKTPGLVETLKKYYGKQNMFFIFLDVSPATSIRRNSGRKICSVCSTAVAASAKPRHCSICMGKLRQRSDDKVEVIKKRLIEYKKRTFPIIAALKKHGYRVIKISGEPLPEKVHRRINNILPH